MPNIDTLSIQFSAKGAKTAVNNIKEMGLAVRSLATNLNAIDGNKMSSFVSSLNNLKKSAPTKGQGNNLSAFSKIVGEMGKSFESVSVSKLSAFASSMTEIKKASITKSQATNLGTFNTAVSGLSNVLGAIDGNKVTTLAGLADGMNEIKKSIPGKSQIERLTAFTVAVTDFSNAIGAANIGEFSKDMATLGDAVQTFKKSSVNSIANAATAMQKLKVEAKDTATSISQAVSMSGQSPKMESGVPDIKAAKTMIKELDRIEIKATGVTGLLQKMGIVKPSKGFKSLADQADKVRNKYQELRTTLQKSLDDGSIKADTPAFQKKMAELDALRNKYDELILKQRELAQEGGAFSFNPTVTKTLDAFKSGFSTVTGLVKNGLLAGLRSVNNHLKSFGARVREAGSALKKTITHGNSATSMAKKFANEIFRVSKMLKLMITRMALRKVIAEVGNGFKSLALHSEQFNASMSNLINGSKQLGYSFAAMVSPLINALAPALTYVIDLLTKFINIVNQILSALTGASTWNRAKEFTGSWADEISEANENAKELKKTVLGFDQLNQLQDNKSSDSGSGIKDMFETVDIDPKWKKFADWLKDMWKMGDFTDLGTKLGEKLRDALESIPWDKIRETSNKLGEALATLINGFVEVERLGYDIGNTIAQSVNTVFEFLNGFVHKLHWDSIGKFIADTFNGFFENIDWALIKDTVVTGMAGLAEAIQSFIENFHWDNISNTIINGVDTIVSGVRAFVEGIEWKDFGGKIGEQIRKSIEGIDWRNIGETLGEIIQAAVDWTTGLLEELPSVETLIEKATDLLEGLFDKVDSQQMGENLATIMNGIYDFLVGFWDKNGGKIKDEVKKFFKGFWDKIDKKDLEKVIGAILTAALIAGIVSATGAFMKTYLAAKITAMVSGVAGQAGVETAATGLGTSIGNWIGAGAVAAVAVYLGSELVEAVQGIWSKLILKGMKEAGYSDADLAKTKEDLEYLSDRYDGLRNQVQLFQDAIHPEKIQLPSETKKSYEDLGIVVEDLRTPVIKIRDEFDDMKITVEKDTAGVSSAVNSIKFTPLSEEASRLDGNTTHAFDNMNRNAQTWSRTINQDTKAGFDSVKLNAKIMTENVPQEVYGATTTISGYVKTLSLDMDKETKTGFTNSENNSKPFTVQMPKEVSTAQKAMSDSVGSLSKDFSSSTTSMKKDVDSSMTDITKSMDSVKKGMDKSNWTFSGVADGLRKTFEDAKNGIKGIWNSIADTLNGEHDVGGSSFHINLPRFARGGFPEDGLFMANHHELVGNFSNGKTAVANNQQIIAGIESGVYNAMVKANGQGGDSKYIANEIIVDGEVLARSVTKAQEKQNRRYSPSMA